MYNLINTSVLQQEFQKMVEVNPDKDISHEVEDFVVENFMDRVNARRKVNTDEKLDQVINFWNDHK